MCVLKRTSIQFNLSTLSWFDLHDLVIKNSIFYTLGSIYFDSVYGSTTYFLWEDCQHNACYCFVFAARIFII